jgi:hypothetical protein
MKFLATLLASMYFFNEATPTAYEVIPEKDIQIKKEFERTILISKKNYPFTNENNNFIDFNHDLMRATGLFSEAQIAKLDIDAIIKVREEYGIDMNNPTHVQILSNGIRIWPGKAIMIPAVYGNIGDQPWIIVSDTINPQRGYKWIQQEFATIVIFQSDFVVPKGFAKAGAHVTPDSIWLTGYVVHGEKDAKWTSDNSEIFAHCTTKLSVQAKNMWDLKVPTEAEAREYLITYPIIDSNGSKGVGMSSTALIPADSGKTHIIGNIVLTW